MSRIGKIARLPHALRLQLNIRLLDGEEGKHLIAWLNELPEVRDILARDFAGRPINDQNLSDWRKGGYVDWHNHALFTGNAITVAEQAREITDALGAAPTESISTIIATQLAAAVTSISAKLSETNPAEILRILAQVTKTLATLRRGDQAAKRIQLSESRLALASTRREEHIVHKFRDWMNRNDGWKHILKEDLTEERRIARMSDLLFGEPLKQDDIRQFLKPDEPEPASPESNFPD